MDKVSDKINEVIKNAVENYNGDYACYVHSHFETLISFGELVDRLSIVNFKLFTLKDTVMNKPDDVEFRAWASIEDVKLVEERARLKKCIDQKLVAMIDKVINGDATGGYNPEVKKYGDGR